MTSLNRIRFKWNFILHFTRIKVITINQLEQTIFFTNLLKHVKKCEMSTKDEFIDIEMKSFRSNQYLSTGVVTQTRTHFFSTVKKMTIEERKT